MLKIGINGIGRIGKAVFREIIDNRHDVTIVGINDLYNVEDILYYLKYDSIYGKLNHNISVENNYLLVNNHKIRVTNKKNPQNINWKDVDASVIIESTGMFLTKQLSELHIKSGAKKVIMSAPSKDNTPMFVMGVNHDDYNLKYDIISNASCTTNCIAPIAKVIHDNFIIKEGLMSTVHASTNTQNLLDVLSKKSRLNRSSLLNIIPHSTGAAIALGKVIPELSNKITGISFRVPIGNVSLLDFNIKTEKSTSYDEIKYKIKDASKSYLHNILSYVEDSIVSQDILKDPRISIFDANAGMQLNKNFFKIIAWYDNEYGYANKLIDLGLYIYKKL
ncbi:MAG: type I glyceraldehyde-3-phosphate dehydrogenase [Bacteroides sp.]|nr:MAG: type I glyceraldehyde-3-phosphate dehydrogenase [Bacteroides sp.]